MEGNVTNGSTQGKIGVCNSYVVTYYWNQAAEGAHLTTNLILAPTIILLALIGCVTNSLLITAYAKNSRLRNPPSMMLVTLACSDLFISTLVEPLYVARLLMEVYGAHSCSLWTLSRLLTYFFCGVSLLTIVIMTVERFVTLAYPYRHHTIVTPTRLKIIVVSTWLTILILIVSHIRIVPQSILLFIGAFLNIFSLIIVISIWIWIHRLLRKHKNTIWTKQTPYEQAEELRCNRKQVFRNTRTSYVVVASVLLCYFPALLVMAYFATHDSVGFAMTFIVDPFVETFMFSNALLNPLLVLWRNKEFRECVREYLPC